MARVARAVPARPRSAPARDSAQAARTRAWPLLAALLLAVAAAWLVPPTGSQAQAIDPDSVRYTVSITNVNRVGLTVTNYGFFGNNLLSRSPSFEFPLGSGFEHMSRAGLWVGGVALTDTGLFKGVSTAIVDNYQGSNASSETEFTPAGTSILERSRITNNRAYSPDAISDQDLITSYSDRPGRGPIGYQSERHTPLGIIVHQQMLGFSLIGADAFEVARFTVINDGPPLQDVYVGLYAQFVSGDRNAYSSWPPSATGGPGSWYFKSHIEYDEARRLYKEHYCEIRPYPDACRFDLVPPWAGLKLLSVHPDTIANKKVSFHWWSFSPGDTLRDSDLERYGLLSDGVVEPTDDCIPGSQACSPIMVLGVGPFEQIDPGDSIEVDFAFVGGEDEQELLDQSDFSQFASDIGFRLPSPPPSPRLRIEAGDERVDFLWDDSPEFASDPTSEAPGGIDFEGYRLYLGLDRQRPLRVAQFDLVDTTGFNTGLEPVRLDPPLMLDGETYRYRYTVTGLRNGLSYFGGVTSYDLGDDQVPSLESGLSQNKFQVVPLPSPGERNRGVTVFPNPYRVEAAWDQGTLVRDHYLWFANLPQRCLLKIFTLAGDLVFSTRFEGNLYHGDNARGLYDPRQDLDTGPPSLSGASFAWNLITNEGQAAATGLYMYSVEDLDTGDRSRGKFLIVKSDREN